MLAALPLAAIQFSFGRIAAAVLMLMVIYVMLRMIGVLRGEGTSGAPAEAVDALRPLRLTMSAPAFLVPATMATALTAAIEFISPWSVVGENPLGLPLFTWRNQVASWSLLLCNSMLLAGFVGLMHANFAGQPARGAAFWYGIRKHTATVFLGKIVLLAGVNLIGSMIEPEPTWQNILFVAPNLLLAPLLGCAALHPGRPIEAIKSTIERSTNSVHGTGKLVTLQVLLMLTIWFTFHHVHGGSMFDNPLSQVPELAYGASVVAFNTFPLCSMISTEYLVADIFLAAAMVISSTAFLAAHFLRVMDAQASRAAAGDAA